MRELGPDLCVPCGDGIVNVRVGAIGYDRSGKAGGAYIAEVMLFGETLSERERTYLEKKLMAKWLATDAVDYRCGVGSLAMSEGTALSISGCGVDAGALSVSGASSVSCEGLALEEGATIDVAALTATSVSCMSVSGAVALPASATVRLSGDGLSKLLPGDYPILTATGSMTGGVSGWTLEVSGFAAWPRPLARLFVQNGAVIVRVRSAGTLFMVF